MPDISVVAAAIAALFVGIALGYLVRRFLAANSVKHAESYAERLMAEARAKQKEIVLEGKDDALKVQRAAEEEAREKRADLQRQERLLLDRSEGLDRKVESLERREVAFEERQREVDAEKAHLAELQQQQLVELERVSGLTAIEARQSLIQLIVDEAQAEAHQKVREIERHAVEEGEEHARRVLTTVMQRIAADHTSEATVTVVEGRGVLVDPHTVRVGDGRAAPLGGDEGPHHRSRGPQHPGARAGHRRGPDHRRHARGGGPLRLRPGASRGGADGAHQADQRRTDPSRTDRGDGRQVPGRDRGGHAAGRRAGGV